MNGRPTTFAPWAGVALLATLLVAALMLAGCGSGGSGQANGQTVAGQVKTAVDDYTAKHGLAFDSSAAMTAFLEGAVPRAGVVDANTKPDAARRADEQVAVLVSGGPMFAFGVYDTASNDGRGVCHYASTYGAGTGRWAYATGSPGVRCGGARDGASELNALVWSADPPEWAQGAARPSPAPAPGASPSNSERGERQITHGERGPSALLSARRATDNS